MRRKRIVAKLMALSLLLSGLPMTSVSAAELPEPMEALEQEVEGEETPVEKSEVEDSAVENTDETIEDSAENNASTEQDLPDKVEITDKIGEIRLNEGQPAVEKLEVAENAKMAGSNGVFYDGVTYLSARNVLAMDEEMQDLYRSLCDEIAVSKEGGLEMQNVVFAVAANGDLYCSYYVPMTALEEIQADMLPDADGTMTPDTEESSAEEKKGDETSEDGKDAVEEKKDDETSEDGKDAVEEEKKDNETSEDGKDAVEEEKKDDETSEDGKDAVEEEKKDDETSEDDKDVVEGEKEDEIAEDELAAEEENDELVEENLDLIPDMEEETFEEIESFRIENTIDLGYGSAVSGELGMSGVQFNAILPTENYFVDQLTESQKTYYNLAKEKLTKGSNKFSYTGLRSLRNAISGDVAHAVSALILAYPDKTDWMAKPGGFQGELLYKLGSSVGTYTFTFDKSKYYSGALDSKAKTQMQTVGNLAQQYAAENYPATPVYGIVKYLDQWVCENGYYEELGTIQLTGFPVLDEKGDPKKDKDGNIIYLTPEQYLKSIGFNNAETQKILNAYYKCHSAYGILLEGYGVCESYAKTMSRLLDAMGIPNIYVVGTAGSGRDAGGHAWNYVQMPNGSWYLLDSTWNDTTNPKDTTSKGTYVLVKEDGEHHETGCNYGNEDVVKGKFSFPARAGSNYAASSAAESITLSESTCNLAPRAKAQLKYTMTSGGSYGKVSVVWSSSDTKVATVDQKGNVTAKAAGTAVITATAAGMTAQCTVNVDQIKAVKTSDNKTSESISLGNTAAEKGSKTVTLTVDMGTSPHKAEWMIANDAKTTAPVVTSSKADVVTAAATVTGNTIAVTVNALKDGNSKVTVKFGGKTVTLNVAAGQIITEDMFVDSWPDGSTAEKTYAYTGKAIKPTVKKKDGDAYKPVTFKTTYVNNVNAGTAKMVVTGTGKYGGVLEYPFTITPIDITEADFSKELKSKVYNGGDNPPAAVVKFANKTLKANKDYEILYTGEGLNAQKPSGALPAGNYAITIRGIGNYTGTVKTTQSYEVTKNTIAKVTASGSASVKYTGLRMNPFTVKIGKNALPDSDYTITWYQGQGKNLKAMNKGALPVAKGKYTAVITVKGDNLTNTDKKKEIQKNFTIK